jgi:hypothetical protein
MENDLDSKVIEELDDLILKILGREPFGLPATKIVKSLPPSLRRIARPLDRYLKGLVTNRRMFSWEPPLGKAKRIPPAIYSIEPLSKVVGDYILRLLHEKDLTPAEMRKQLPTHIKSHLMIFLNPVVNDGRIKWHPPIKGKRLSLRDPDPVDFLSAEIRKLFEKGQRLGFERKEILEAVQRNTRIGETKKALQPSIREIEDLVFKAMKGLKPSAAQGALVYIPDLRNALRAVFPDKESFDRAILDLAKNEKVQLQSHSLPSELSNENKAAMIDNNRGSYFMAVGIRME